MNIAFENPRRVERFKKPLDKLRALNLFMRSRIINTDDGSYKYKVIDFNPRMKTGMATDEQFTVCLTR